MLNMPLYKQTLLQTLDWRYIV